MIRRRRFVVISIVAAALAASSCGHTPPPAAPAPPPQAALTIAAAADAKVKATMVIATSADTNPDASGRPSPIVIRVYQLRTDAAFTSADFAALFADDQKVLGQELISRNEFMLAPMERQTLDITVAGDTRFVGAVAAFRDIRNAQWRSVVPAPREGLTVSVERARVVLTAAAK
jgi:type VI secretion system protein VasD